MSKMQGKVAIVDFGMGNLFSVQRACAQAGLSAEIIHNKSDIENADGLIFPGVGSFGNAMQNLIELDLVQPLKDFIASGQPFLGICLGMQLLMSESEEFGRHVGLDIIPGKVKWLDLHQEVNKVPEVGWNKIFAPDQRSELWKDTPLQGMRQGENMYFVHSYYVEPEDKGIVVSETNYEGISFCSALRYKNIFAVQFHPEKSTETGIQIYDQWSAQIRGVPIGS